MGKWIQIKDANWRIPYVGGWCEGYVEGAWGKATKPTPSNQTTNGHYASAEAAWQAEPVLSSHAELPPMGITVPVYFKLGSTNQGHVAIRLSDGMVASSTQAGYHPKGYLHPNIQDLINLYARYNKGCKYLGWGEHVGGMRVVQYVPNVANATDAQIKALYLEILERPADKGGLATYRKVSLATVRSELLKSPEYKALPAKKAAAAKAKEAAQVKAAADAKAKAAADAKAKADAIKNQPPIVVPAPPTDYAKENNGLLKQIIDLIKRIFNIKE